jgi:hypothetical protein
MEVPNSKHKSQINSDHPNSDPSPHPSPLGESGRVRGYLKIGIWSLFGILDFES